jgi:hypothetical protein
MTDNMIKKWFGLALSFFLLIAVEGLIIRWLPFQNIIDKKNYYNILQSHSHTSFLGWVLIALLLFIIFDFRLELFRKKSGTNLFLTIFCFIVIISGISFVLSGYSVISIVSLVLFLLVSYYGFYKVLQKIDKLENRRSRQIYTIFVRTAIIFYFISSISTWVLPVLIITEINKSPFYFYNIYFYLHFLINGFITFAILSIFLKNSTYSGTTKEKNLNYRIFILLITGTILTYSGSLLWNKVHLIFNILNFTGALLIIIPIIYFTGFVSEYLRKAMLAEKLLFIIAWISLILKVLMQLSQSLPFLAEASYILKGQLIVGYMHLVTLGFISSFIISYAFRIGLFKNSVSNTITISLYIISLVLTELTLFTHGILMIFGIYILSPFFNLLMLVFTVPLAFSIFSLSINFFIDYRQIKRGPEVR